MVAWSTGLGSERSKFSRGEAKPQIYRANTRRDGDRRPRASVAVSVLSNTSPWSLSLVQERLQLRGSGRSVARTGILTVKRKVAE